jgi:hypothetical protein
MRVARKTFLAGTMLAATAGALAGCKTKNASSAADQEKLGRIVYPVLTPSDYEYAGMMAKIRVANPHKQLFPQSSAAVQPGTGYAALFNHMGFAMNGYQFSIGPAGGHLATLGVLSGSAIVLALNDEMWRKYAIGDRYGMAPTNVYYHAMSDLDPNAAPDDPKGLYQDWSAQAVLKRGGSLMVCHNATTYVATEFAMRHKLEPEMVLHEWLHNLLPGFMIVPAGILAVQLASENGWKIYAVT